MDALRNLKENKKDSVMKINIENAINQALSYMAQDPNGYKYTIYGKI